MHTYIHTYICLYVYIPKIFKIKKTSRNRFIYSMLATSIDLRTPKGQNKRNTKLEVSAQFI